MRLPLRAALSVFVSAAIVIFLVFFLPPLVVDKRELFGHDRFDAIAVADRLLAELEGEGEGRSLLASYKARYPYLDFELLSPELEVLAASAPAPSRYSLVELARRIDSEWDREYDSQTVFREIPGRGAAAYLLVTLRSPFYLSLSLQASRFIAQAFLISLALAILVFGLVLAAFSLPFARRVSRLARDISAYEPGLPIPSPSARDETGSIATAFARMARRLESAEAGRREKEEEWRAAVANLSHDLRTPLASVLGYSESIVSGAYEGEEERSRYESIIHAKALYMDGLLDSLLAYARLGSSGPDEAREAVDLCELSRSIVIEYLDKAERAGVSIEAEIPDSPLVALTRPESLSRALRNLIDNALKYGGSGERLEFRLGSAGSSLRLELRDFGPGIAAEDRERIFERHYRGDPARGGSTGGLGLGLPIARAIARREGGELFVERPEGGGCRFVLELPFQERQAGITASRLGAVKGLDTKPM